MIDWEEVLSIFLIVLGILGFTMIMTNSETQRKQDKYEFCVKVRLQSKLCILEDTKK